MKLDPHSPRTLGSIAAVFSAFFVFLLGGAIVLKVWVDERNLARDTDTSKVKQTPPVVEEKEVEKPEATEPKQPTEKKNVPVRKKAKKVAVKSVPESPKIEPPPPAPPKVKTGKGNVMVTGNAKRVRFYGPPGTFGPGKLPAGSYQIQATFPGSGPIMAGTIEVNGGDRFVVSCSASSQTCVRR